MSVTNYHADWLSPDGERHECPPRYDTDPDAAMELLRNAVWLSMTRHAGGLWICTIRLDSNAQATSDMHTRPEAAMAEAYLAAMKGEKGG